MKATFFERLGAYLIDIIIVSLIVSIIVSIVPSKDTNVTNDLATLTNNFVNNEITNDVYIKEYQNLIYTSSKNNISESVVSLVITIAYFIVFQFLNKGRTIGKLALNLTVVDNENDKPVKLINLILRELIPFGILTSFINIITISFLNKNAYFKIYYAIGAIETLFIIGTILAIIIRKDNRGLHDIIAKTKVIKKERR